MGVSYAKLKLANVRRPDLAPMEVDALADTGAVHLCIPQHVAVQLQLDELDKREVTIADGPRHLASYVGPLIVSFGNRQCFTGAMVLGEQALLGVIPMEDMDLVVHPKTQQVIANPNNPNIPGSLAMGVRHR